MVRPIVPPEPILHPEFFPRLKVAVVDFQATAKIVRVNAFSPAVSQLLGHPSTRKDQPRSIKPDAPLVFARHPNHYGCGIHHLAKPLVESSGALNREVNRV